MKNQNLKFLILVVIFNKHPLDSTTINSLNTSSDEIKDAKLVIWDNSLIKAPHNHLEQLKKQWNKFEYIHTPSNTPLSIIYNKIINSIKDPKQFGIDYDYFIIFDQDSIFTKDYFIKLKKTINLNETISLFVPRVYSNNTMVSPGNLYYFKGFYLKSNIEEGLVLSKHKTVINSGMVISTTYLCNYFKGYDENMTFYGIDDYFMINYAKSQKYFVVFDYNLNHHLSKFADESKATKQWRNLNALLSIRIILKEFNFFIRFIGYIYLFYFVIKYKLFKTVLKIKHN